MKNLYLLVFVLGCFGLNAQWDSCGVTNGLNNPSVQGIESFTEHQGRLFAHTVMSGLLYSDNDGDTWNSLNFTFTGAVMYIFSIDQRLYASTMVNGAAGGYQYYSDDLGQTWVIDTTGMPGSAINANYKATVQKAQRLGDYIFYQFNIPKAFQWRHKDSAVYHEDAYGNINQLSGWYIHNDTLWGLLQGDCQFVTNPRGPFTPSANNNLPYVATGLIQKTGSNIYVVGRDNNLDWVLYRSRNSGADWDSVYLQNLLGTGSFGLKRGVNALYSFADEVYLGPLSKGQNSQMEILHSSDEGDTWSIDSLNLPTDPFGTNTVRHFVKTNQYIYASLAFKDVYRKDLGSGSINLDELNSNQVSLFPNPIQGYFKLEANFSIEAIIVRAVDGSEIKRFKSQETYQLTNLSGGLYWVELIGQEGQLERIPFVLQP